jgi:hypothetical protein
MEYPYAGPQWICIHTINMFTLERLLACPFCVHGRTQLDMIYIYIYIWHTCVLGREGSGDGGAPQDHTEVAQTGGNTLEGRESHSLLPHGESSQEFFIVCFKPKGLGFDSLSDQSI